MISSGGFAPLELPASNRSAADPNKGAAGPGICPNPGDLFDAGCRCRLSIALATRIAHKTGGAMITPTKNAYWTLVDEHTDTQMNTKIETITYEAKASGGKLVRTVTRNRDAFVESIVFVPMPPMSPAV
jgi:hypothetical protein